MTERIVVVGAGILGLTVARRLTQLRPDAQLVVLDKELRVAAHQTGHNSGVAHAGLYYPPGSLKAQLCRRGIGMLAEFCAEHGLAFTECGKLVIARTADEVPALREIERRSTANEVPGLARLDAAGLREIESHAAGVAALHSPHTAIVDYVAVAQAVAAELRAGGHEVRLGFEVAGVHDEPGGTRLVSRGGDEVRAERVVVCAGLQADRVARLAGDTADPAIVAFRGEYHRLVPAREHLVRGLIYPVPDPSYPFLGVHFTRRVGGGVDVGPNAVLATAREGYRRRDVVARDLAETLRWPGFAPLARAHWRTGAAEAWGSLSTRAFLARATDYLPGLVPADVERAPAGVRAQALGADGALVDDFRIGQVGRVVTVRNAPSPAATSAFAIAEVLAERVLA